MKEMELKRLSRMDSASDFASWPLLAQATKQTGGARPQAPKMDASIDNELALLAPLGIGEEKAIRTNEMRFSHILSKPRTSENDVVAAPLSVKVGLTPLKPLLKSIAAHSSKLASR